MATNIVFFLYLISVSVGYDRTRCLLHHGRCALHCPRNMHPYHTRCDGQTLSQRTCDDRVVYILGYTCGWSRCDCNGDLLLDEQTGLCVTLNECVDLPEKLRKKYKEDRESKRGRKLRMSKRVKVKKDNDEDDT